MQLFVDPPLCSVHLSVVAASLTYCCLLVGNGCWRCQSFPRQSCLAYAVPWCLSVLCDGTAGCRAQPTGPSVSHAKENYLCLTCCLCTCVFVFLEKNSALTQVFTNRQPYHEHTHCAVVKHQAGLHLHSSFIHSSISFYFLVLLRVFYSHPFFSSPFANLIPVLFLLSFPLLSSFSHAPVGEYNEMAMAVLWCVCVRACVLVFFCVMLHYVAL